MPPKSAQLLTAAASPDMRSSLMSNTLSGLAVTITGIGDKHFIRLLRELKGHLGQVA